MAQDNKRGVASVLNALGSCAGLLEASPRHLREVAHHHFVSDQLSEDLIGSFFGPVGLPPLQLQHPVVLLGRETRAIRLPVGPVQQGTFSRCGRYYAVGAGKGIVALVDRRSGEQRLLEGHEGVVRSVVFSSCGGFLYSAGRDGCIRGWTVPDLSQVGVFEGHKKQVNQLAVSPDGGWLASASDDGRVRLWGLQGQEHRALVGHPMWVSSLAWIDSDRLVSGSADSTLSVWTATGHAMQPIYGHIHPVTALATCARRGLIASGDQGGMIRLWDASTLESVEVLRGHSGAVADLEFDASGDYLMSASGDRTVVVWDSVSKAILGRFPGHKREVVSVSWSPEGQPTSLSADRIHREWSMAAIRPHSRKTAHQAGVRSCSVTPNGQILSASRDYTIAMWSANDMIRVGELQGHTGSVESICVVPPGDRALSASTDGRLLVWDLGTREVLREIECGQGPLTGCGVAHSGRLHLSAGRDGTLKIWDGDTGELWHTIRGHTDRVRTCLVHPDSRRIVTGSYDSNLFVWEASTGRCLGGLALHTAPVIDAALSPSGDDLVAASLDGSLSFWDMETGGLLAHVSAHEGGAIAVCPLGENHMASAGMDGFIRVWDTEHAVCVHHHPIGSGPAAMSSEGTRLVCGDKQGNLWVFNWEQSCLTPEDWPAGNPRLLDML